jgi:hypothetical protein
VKILTIVLVTWFLMSCTSTYKIKISSFERVNETSFVFPIDFDDILKKSNILFSYENQKNNQIRLSGVRNSAVLYSKVIQLSDDGFKIQLGDISRSFWRSDFYTVNGEPAETTGVFTVEFKATENNKTLVSVKVEKLEVINGIECCGPHGRYSRYTNVEATTIEEYAILFYLGEQLGVSMHKPYRPVGG